MLKLHLPGELYCFKIRLLKSLLELIVYGTTHHFMVEIEFKSIVQFKVTLITVDGLHP